MKKLTLTFLIFAMMLLGSSPVLASPQSSLANSIVGGIGIDALQLIQGGYSSYVDNRSSSTPYVNTLTITNSASQGSEWSGSVSFSGSIRTGMLGEIGTEVSGGVKEFRDTNEAVGASGSMTIPAYMQGRNEAYYGGMSSNGTLYYHVYDDNNGQNIYYTTAVNCKVHKNYFDVNFKPVVW